MGLEILKVVAGKVCDKLEEDILEGLKNNIGLFFKAIKDSEEYDRLLSECSDYEKDRNSKIQHKLLDVKIFTDEDRKKIFDENYDVSGDILNGKTRKDLENDFKKYMDALEMYLQSQLDDGQKIILGSFERKLADVSNEIKEEIVNVNDNVSGVKEDVGVVKNSIDDMTNDIKAIQDSACDKTLSISMDTSVGLEIKKFDDKLKCYDSVYDFMEGCIDDYCYGYCVTYEPRNYKINRNK